MAQGCNFLLLDEPVNHLDIPSRSRFERAMAAFQGTVRTIVHERYFKDRFAAGLWTIQGVRFAPAWIWRTCVAGDILGNCLARARARSRMSGRQGKKVIFGESDEG